MSNKLDELILTKSSEMAKLIFVPSYIIPSLVDNMPNVVIIQVGTINILYNASYEDIAQNIIKLGSNCIFV